MRRVLSKAEVAAVQASDVHAVLGHSMLADGFPLVYDPVRPSSLPSSSFHFLLEYICILFIIYILIVLLEASD